MENNKLMGTNKPLRKRISLMDDKALEEEETDDDDEELLRDGDDDDYEAEEATTDADAEREEPAKRRRTAFKKKAKKKMISHRPDAATAVAKKATQNPAKIKRGSYCCPNCGYSTIRRDHFTTHLRTHTEERLYECTFGNCDYKAASKCTLNRHGKKHTGVKPYKCTSEGCEFAASRKDNLNCHMRKHITATFKCPFGKCKYITAEREALNIHLRIHDGAQHLEVVNIQAVDHPPEPVGVQLQPVQQDQHVDDQMQLHTIQQQDDEHLLAQQHIQDNVLLPIIEQQIDLLAAQQQFALQLKQNQQQIVQQQELQLIQQQIDQQDGFEQVQLHTIQQQHVVGDPLPIEQQFGLQSAQQEGFQLVQQKMIDQQQNVNQQEEMHHMEEHQAHPQQEQQHSESESEFEQKAHLLDLLTTVQLKIYESPFHIVWQGATISEILKPSVERNGLIGMKQYHKIKDLIKLAFRQFLPGFDQDQLSLVAVFLENDGTNNRKMQDCYSDCYETATLAEHDLHYLHVPQMKDNLMG